MTSINITSSFWNYKSDDNNGNRNRSSRCQLNAFTISE